MCGHLGDPDFPEEFVERPACGDGGLPAEDGLVELLVVLALVELLGLARLEVLDLGPVHRGGRLGPARHRVPVVAGRDLHPPSTSTASNIQLKICANDWHCSKFIAPHDRPCLC